MIFIWAPISWALFLVLRTAFITMGFVMVPAGVLSGVEYRESKIYPGRQVLAFKHKMFWLWGNEEEGIGWYDRIGILNNSWLNLTINLKHPVLKILYSEIIRNPANNLRFVPVLSVKIDPARVRFIGSFGDLADNFTPDLAKRYDSDDETFWLFAWCGWYSNIRFHFDMFGKRRRLWLGWKVYAHDSYGIPDWDHRKASAGFATQFKRID